VSRFSFTPTDALRAPLLWQLFNGVQGSLTVPSISPSHGLPAPMFEAFQARSLVSCHRRREVTPSLWVTPAGILLLFVPNSDILSILVRRWIPPCVYVSLSKQNLCRSVPLTPPLEDPLDLSPPPGGGASEGGPSSRAFGCSRL